MTATATRTGPSTGRRQDTLGNVVLLNGRRIDWTKPPKATTKVMWFKRDTSGRKITGSLRTMCHLDRLNRLALAKYGSEVVVIQPPYNTTVPASAGTHDFDCCIDLYIPGVSWWDQQRFFRANGLLCWYRHPPMFGNHIHGITLPPREGTVLSDDFEVHGFQVGVYVDGGYSREGRQATSSQIEDGYAHAFGLAGQHTPGSDKSWWPADLESTIFDLDAYIARRRREQQGADGGGVAGQQDAAGQQDVAEQQHGTDGGDGGGPARRKRPGHKSGHAGGAMVVHGADLSHHNEDPALVRAREAGLMFVYHKATEGSTVRDPQYPARRAAARKARLPFGAYHFASPDHDDAAVEARAFLEYADPQAGDLVPALDMEVAGSERLEAWSKRFMAEVLRLLEQRGLRPKDRLIHYGPDDYGPDYPFLRWVPRYNNSNEPPTARFDIWQFSNGELGVPHSFPGLAGKVDLNTMRPGLTVDSLLLERLGSGDPHPGKGEDENTGKGGSKGGSQVLGDVVSCAHASLEFSLSPAQHTHDIEAIFAHESARDAKWITGTEAGRAANNTAKELTRIGKAHGYTVFVPKAGTDCWVAVAEDFIGGEWKTGYTKVIDSSRKSGDPHHYCEKGVVWVQFFSTTYGTISIAAAHHLTAGAATDAGRATDPVNHQAANMRLSHAIGDWATEHSSRRNLAFFGGDTNMRDKDTDVFFGAPLTTLWDELNVHENTGHGNIDVIASCDHDGRVVGKSCHALDDKEIQLDGDHFLVDGAFYVRPIAPADGR